MKVVWLHFERNNLISSVLSLLRSLLAKAAKPSTATKATKHMFGNFRHVVKRFAKKICENEEDAENQEEVSKTYHWFEPHSLYLTLFIPPAASLMTYFLFCFRLLKNCSTAINLAVQKARQFFLGKTGYVKHFQHLFLSRPEFYMQCFASLRKKKVLFCSGREKVCQ